MKVRSAFINIKVNRFNMRFNRFFNKPSSKTNACTIKGSTIVKNHVDVRTLIVKIVLIYVLAQIIILLRNVSMHVLAQMIILLKIK